MTQPATIARPYASALFALSRGDAAVIKQWQRILFVLSEIVVVLGHRDLLEHPDLSFESLVGFCRTTAAAVCGALGEPLEAELYRFLRLLVERKRVAFLGDIATAYDALCAAAASVIEAEVTSSKPLSEAEKSALSKALGQRFASEVSVTYHEDSHLLGGAVVRVGDWVLDGSVRRRLERLRETLATV